MREKCAVIYKRTVVNIVAGVQEACDVVAKAIYGEEAFAVSVTNLDVLIGDRYIDGIFYRMNGSGEWIPLGGET